MKFLLILSLLSKNSLANPIACSVCTVAIISGLSISRALGVNDAVIGIWSGAILLAISNIIVNYLKNKKNINNIYINLFIYIFNYIMVLPLYIGKNPSIKFNYNKILFIDSFLFSVLIGSLTLLFSSKLYYYMKEKNNGKAHFPFEKVVLPISSLILASFIFNFI